MKRLLWEINRFREISGLIIEQDTKCVGDCKNGKGKKTKDGVFEYDGEFKNSKYHGKGTFIQYKEGNKIYILSGEWKEGDLYNGKSEYNPQDEKRKYIFEGSFYNNSPKKGKLTLIGYERSVELNGTFTKEDGKLHFISDDKKINTNKDYVDIFDYVDKYLENKALKDNENDIKDNFENEKQTCINGNCENGKGISVGSFGKYDGNFKEGKFEGGGELNTQISEYEFVVTNSELTDNFHDHMFIYKGSFKDGKLNGKGKITFRDGSYYEGEFKDNKIDGQGKFTFNNSSFEGILKSKINEKGFAKYSYETLDKKITDDLLKFYKENPAQHLTYNTKELENFKTTITLNVKVAEDSKTRILSGLQNGTPIKEKIDLYLKNTIFPKKSYRVDLINGIGKVENFELGNYDLILDVPKYKKLKKNILIDNSYIDGMTIYVNKTLNEQTEVNIKEEIKKCEKKINDFYNYYISFYNEKLNLKTVTEVFLYSMKTKCTDCAIRYYRKFNKDIQKKIRELTNVSPKKITDSNETLDYYFDIEYSINENRNIYNKTNTLSISNSIRKVINEQSQIKKDLVIEKNIIEKRFQFILNTSDKFDLNENLHKETKQLINKGYNKDIVKRLFRSYLK